MLPGGRSTGTTIEEETKADGFIHTVYANGEWANTVEGADSSGGTYATKEEAVTAGRELAREGPPSTSSTTKTAPSRSAAPMEATRLTDPVDERTLDASDASTLTQPVGPARART